MNAIARVSTEYGADPSSASKTSFAVPGQDNYSITPVVQHYWRREDKLCNGACVEEEEILEEIVDEILEEVLGETLEEIQG